MREPKGWRWQDGDRRLQHTTTEPEDIVGPPAFVLGISASVSNERVRSAMPVEASIWRADAIEPPNDIVRHPDDQANFRSAIRHVLDAIKSRHGVSADIAVFPAMPASCAVEFGCVWMPKADLPIRTHDEQRGRGFVEVFEP